MSSEIGTGNVGIAAKEATNYHQRSCFFFIIVQPIQDPRATGSLNNVAVEE